MDGDRTRYFHDWSITDGIEVVPGDVVWTITGDQVQLIRAEIAAGAAFSLHSHPQEQIIFVQEGAREFTVDATTQVVHAGGVICVPGGISHGGRVCGALRAVTIEAFHPPRSDFRHPASQGDLDHPA
jgi:quercetin dioxygenase-like cupin family protein